MALPDLDPSLIGPLAFWNHLDQGGADSVDVQATESLMDSSTLYSNGVDGYKDINLPGSENVTRRVHMRAKDDGWFIAWINQDTANLGYDQPDGVGAKGPFDIWRRWSESIHNKNFEARMELLFDRIANMFSEQPNSGNQGVSFSRSDIFLASLLNQDKDAYTAFSFAHRDQDARTDFSIGSNTTLGNVWCTAHNASGGDSPCDLRFAGGSLVKRLTSGGSRISAVGLTGQPTQQISAGNDYQVEVSPGDSNTDVVFTLLGWWT